MIVTPEGLKVFPEDVELVLNRIPGVRDSAAVGRERVHAVLILENDANKDEIVRRANAALENHQKIRSVSVWTADALPRTEGTGKLRRAAIQRWVDGGARAVASGSPNGITELIQKYIPDRTITSDTTLEELGLSSLEQVELMVELEERFDITVDEAAPYSERDAWPISSSKSLDRQPCANRDVRGLESQRSRAPSSAGRIGRTHPSDYAPLRAHPGQRARRHSIL